MYCVWYIKPVLSIVIASVWQFERGLLWVAVILAVLMAGPLSIAAFSWDIVLEAAVWVIVESKFLVVAGDGPVQVPTASEIDCGVDGVLQSKVTAIPVAETLKSRWFHHWKVDENFGLRHTWSDVNGNQNVHRSHDNPNQNELALIVGSLAQEFGRRLPAGSVHIEWRFRAMRACYDLSPVLLQDVGLINDKQACAFSFQLRGHDLFSTLPCLKTLIHHGTMATRRVWAKLTIWREPSWWPLSHIIVSAL